MIFVKKLQKLIGKNKNGKKEKNRKMGKGKKEMTKKVEGTGKGGEGISRETKSGRGGR